MGIFSPLAYCQGESCAGGGKTWSRMTVGYLSHWGSILLFQSHSISRDIREKFFLLWVEVYEVEMWAGRNKGGVTGMQRIYLL